MSIKPRIYTEIEVIKITKLQKETLKKLKNYKVNKSKFIRDAIQEKLEREKHIITKKKQYCPLSGLEIKNPID